MPVRFADGVNLMSRYFRNLTWEKRVGAPNDIRKELDGVWDRLTGEDATDYLLKNYGWGVAKAFSTHHNSITNGKGASIPHSIGEVTRNPLYSRKELDVWAESVEAKGVASLSSP